MSKRKDNTLQYKKAILHGFESLEPGNNGIIETKKLDEFTKAMNSKQKYPFLYNTIKSLSAKKFDENDENLSVEEYLSFINEKLNDIETREGLKSIYSVFCDENKNNFSWTKLAVISKELGDDETANKLLKLLEQAKLYTKDLDFKEFCDIVREDYLMDININNDNEDYENKETYKKKKIKNKRIVKKEEEEEERETISSKENKKSGDDNDGEKSNKRYHRRYRDNKNKNDNNENGNSNGNSTNKIHSKYRKKH
jgi:Ca2+-binding EF-hand superfamily protein